MTMRRASPPLPTVLVVLCMRSAARSPGSPTLPVSSTQLATLWHASERLSVLSKDIPLVVATDSHRIAAFADQLGRHAVLTGLRARTDLQMVTELSRPPFHPAEICVSVSAEDLTIRGADVERVLDHLQHDDRADAVTLCRSTADIDLARPFAARLLVDGSHRLRGVTPALAPLSPAPAGCRHVAQVAIAGYRRRTLHEWRDFHASAASWDECLPTPLGQLLQAGFRVDVLPTPSVPVPDEVEPFLQVPARSPARRRNDLQPQLA